MTYLLKTFAKLNLSLKVNPPRPDGLHPIKSIFQSISLHDDIQVSCTPNKKEFTLTCSNPNIPTDNQNLVTKISRFFANQLSCGLSIHIEKNIPCGAGLGGGSANAAGMLRILNQLIKSPYTTEDLMKIGLNYGADIPFFLVGGTATVTGIGEIITPIQNNKPKQYYLLIYPNIFSNTKEIYDLFDKNSQNKNTDFANDLKAVTFNRYPTLIQLEETCLKLNYKPVHMSGSGSTIFIPCKDKKEGLNRQKKLNEIFPDYFIYLAHSQQKSMEITKKT
jgi:4-diphosphocytidyl-2-C-methyl-D-erythritol kinase